MIFKISFKSAIFAEWEEILAKQKLLTKKIDSWINCRDLKSWLCHKFLNMSIEHLVFDKVWVEWTNYSYFHFHDAIF